jgi:hypothetical protein
VAATPDGALALDVRELALPPELVEERADDQALVVQPPDDAPLPAPDAIRQPRRGGAGAEIRERDVEPRERALHIVTTTCAERAWRRRRRRPPGLRETSATSP